MSNFEGRQCMTCVYYVARPERDKGDCHRYPQTITKKKDGYCGEWADEHIKADYQIES